MCSGNVLEGLKFNCVNHSSCFDDVTLQPSAVQGSGQNRYKKLCSNNRPYNLKTWYLLLSDSRFKMVALSVEGREEEGTRRS